MQKNELDYVIDHNQYFKGGTKEACVKAKDFLKNATFSEDKIFSSLSCVTAQEFIDAVKVLMAFTFTQKDTIPETWQCDNDCSKVSDFICPGECNINKNSVELCPFFTDEGML